MKPVERRKAYHSAYSSQAFQDTSRKQTAEGTTKQRSGIEDSHAERKLGFGVPLGEVKQSSCKERRF